ncbi:MAG: N,N-dimethylformamidase beta subunit family domain-containing protein [Sphingomonas sp.]
MQVYAIDPSFASGQPFTIGVRPGSRFSVAFYAQGGGESLYRFGDIVAASTENVTQIRPGIFESGGHEAPIVYDQDWAWPTITFAIAGATVPSGAYMAVAYDVDATGAPTTELGRRCAAGAPLDGYPPDSDAMALLICRPATPTAAIAYVIPTATYHAYNSTGGGCFYDDHVHGTDAQWRVSLLRPGGGLGAQLGEPADPYDPDSPRQQFTHWDAKFVRWLIAQGIACDFYTDLDLHDGTLDLSAYRCMLSVGHHEYWSAAMRDAVARFLRGGGNLAVFSGNTCFRPIDFGDRTPEAMKVVRKLADHWPDYDESDLLGLSYGFGGGHWGDWEPRAGWINTGRDPIGFTVRDASHWAFAGCGLADGDTFGDEDHLVGYEVDGVPSPSNGFHVLADTRRLTGWEMEGVGAMGIFGDERNAGPKAGLVFNGGTTDWARVLIDEAASSRAVVSRITTNVLRAFTGSDS